MKPLTVATALACFSLFACSGESPETTVNPAQGGTAGSASSSAGTQSAGGSTSSSIGGGSSESTGGSELVGTSGASMNGPSGSGGSAMAGGSATADLDAGLGGTDAGGADTEPAAGADTADDGSMTFFVTSSGMGDGGNLGGLAGADAFCEQLAIAADADLGRRLWRAYLSTDDVDAIDRIGTGPWRNASGDIIANDAAQLHDGANVDPGGPLDGTWPIGDFSIALDEQGNQLANNVHDILTGTLLDGSAAPGLNCNDWTSNSPDVQARIGHNNRTGLAGQRQLFQDVHDVGCAPTTGNFQQNTVSQGGGRGSIYCFAVITE